MTNNSEENFNHFDENKFFKLKTNRRDKYVDCPYCGTVLRNVSQICKNCNSIIEIQKPSVLQDFQQYFLPDIKKFTKFFLIFNLTVFFLVGFSNSLFRPHPIAKFFLSNAVTVNSLYIFPLNKVFGWDNILAKPFYPVREVLYQTGLFFLPLDDGERELWWFAVKFKEFEWYTSSFMYKEHAYYQIRKIKKILNFYNEIYSHIESLTTLKIKDKHLRDKRYNIAVGVLYGYGSSYPFFNHRIIKKIAEGEESFIKKEDKIFFESVYLDSKELIFRSEYILKEFAKLREYTEKNEPEGLIHFSKTKRYYEDTLLITDITDNILQEKDNLNTIKCDDPIIRLFAISRYKSKMYMYDTNLPVPDRNIRIRYSTLIIHPHWRKLLLMCPSCKYQYLQDVEIDCVDTGGSFLRSVFSGQRIKNNYYEKLSVWDELKKYVEMRSKDGIN